MGVENKHRITRWVKSNLIKSSSHNNRFYAEFLLFVNISRCNNIKTMGVNIVKSKLNLYYNEEFVNGLSKNDLTFILIHEVCHLLSNHTSRIKWREFKLSNIAQDMIINTNIINSIYLPAPKNAYNIPSEYTGKHIYEFLYDYVKKEKDEYDKNKNDDKYNKIKNGQSADYDKMIESFDNIDNGKSYTIDEHNKKDEMELQTVNKLQNELIKDVIENIKQRGLLTSNVEQLINRINKSKKNYLKFLKLQVSNKLFGTNQKRSYRQMNRYGINGLKGSIQTNKEINVILDTSGSMNNFNKVLSYIFKNGYQIRLIQIDTTIKSVQMINNKKELKNILIKGGGGTTIQPAFDYLISNKLNKIGTLLLTDGYTDSLNLDKFKSILILSTNTNCPILNNPKLFKQIIVND